MMKFRVLASSSSGNCFFVDDIMIDAGVPYSLLKDVISTLKFVLLTHIHGDHFNRTTIRKLFVNTDAEFVIGEWLKDDLLSIGVTRDKMIILEMGCVFDLENGFKISPFPLYHDVPNCGYRLLKNGKKHIHMTDTDSLEGITAKDYDSASIECNYEPNKVEELVSEADVYEEFTHLKGSIHSHLSVVDTVDFVKKNHIKKLIPVHLSSYSKKEVLDYINAHLPKF